MDSVFPLERLWRKLVRTGDSDTMKCGAGDSNLQGSSYPTGLQDAGVCEILHVCSGHDKCGCKKRASTEAYDYINSDCASDEEQQVRHSDLYVAKS